MMTTNPLDFSEIKLTIEDEIAAETARLQAEANAAQRAEIEERAAENVRLARERIAGEQAAALAEFETVFVSPTVAAFAEIDKKAATLNARIADWLEQGRGFSGEQQVLAGELLAASRAAGLCCDRIGLAPSRVPLDELSQTARTLWENAISDSAIWKSGIETGNFKFSLTEKFFALVESAFMAHFWARPRLMPSNVPVVPTPAPQPAPAAPRPMPRQTRRSTYLVETWVREHAAIGIGSTSAEDCFQNYCDCCQLLGVTGVTSDVFATELQDLLIDGTGTKKGYFYFLRLK